VTVLPDSRIVLAPLAGGPSTPELAAAVARAGGLPFLGAGYLTAQALAEQLGRTRSLTEAPFGVNIFVLRDRSVDDAAVAAYADELQPEAARVGVRLGEPHFDDDGFDAKLSVALAAGAAVVSFTFGCPERADIARIHAAGAEAWLTVTSLAEAQTAAQAGPDALVVQGAEAGGHRGNWDDTDHVATPLQDLLRTTAAAVGLPLVATGGIADREGVRAALAAGAAAAQIGTAFLLADEAGTSEPHRRAISTAGETAFTRAFTGRRARGLVNEFMRRHPHAPSAYPHIHHLTAPLRAAARAAGDADGINLWAGTNAALARAEPAAEIVARLRA
jgi:nitronate monooxygenase